MSPSNLLIGFAFSITIAALGYWRGALSKRGALGAILVGAIIFAGGGLLWAIVLIAFFVSASALSHYQARVKAPLAEKFQKGRRRDLGQVLANGGWGALLALAYAFNPDPTLFAAYLGAIATVTADTWATELGVLSKTPPRLITTGKIVPTGTSGAVTLLGTLVAFCGALFVGVVAGASGLVLSSSPVSDVLRPISPRSVQPPISIYYLPITALSGFLGSLFDSWLGATVQGMYFCKHERTVTEARVHRCGRATRLIRGWRWMDNDAVNFITSVFGCAVVVGWWGG